MEEEEQATLSLEKSEGGHCPASTLLMPLPALHLVLSAAVLSGGGQLMWLKGYTSLAAELWTNTLGVGVQLHAPPIIYILDRRIV